jgi:hypothetical protein
MTEAPTTELDVFFPTEVTVELAGEQFVLEAFKAGRMRPYLNINRRMEENLQQLGTDMAHEFERKNKAAIAAGQPPLASPDFDRVPEERIFEYCAEEYIDLVQLATGKPRAWVEDLGMDELVAAASIIIKLCNERYLKKATAPTVAGTRRG